VLVGAAGSPGSRGRAQPLRLAAPVGPVQVPAGVRDVRVQGEAELTSCTSAYSLCERGTADVARAQVWLHAESLRADGRVCRKVDGPVRQVAISPAVHHVKVLLSPATVSTHCGATVRAWIAVQDVRGNAIEIEPVLPGGRGQTQTWLEPAG
jgi:hypothetical protein